MRPSTLVRMSFLYLALADLGWFAVRVIHAAVWVGSGISHQPGRSLPTLIAGKRQLIASISKNELTMPGRCKPARLKKHVTYRPVEGYWLEFFCSGKSYCGDFQFASRAAFGARLHGLISSLSRLKSGCVQGKTCFFCRLFPTIKEDYILHQ